MARNEEIFARLLKEEEENDKFTGEIGIKLVDADEGYCKGEMVVEDRHKNPFGTVHGGCLYALADTIAGCAAATCGMEGPTLSGNMYFLRATIGVQKLTCEANVIKNGKRIRVVEATIFGDHGEEIARSMIEYVDLQRSIIVHH